MQPAVDRIGRLGPPAIAHGTLYVNGPDGIDAFDAAGSTRCSGTPKVCTPLWSYTAPNFGPFGSPIVANGVLYYTSGASSLGFGLHAWDVSGTSNRSGVPQVCRPLFSHPSDALVIGDPAVAFGTVYIADGDMFDSEMAVFAFKLP